MKNEFEELKKLDVLEVHNIKKYSISAIISLTLLLGVIGATFFVFVLPMHKIWLNIAFIGGIITGIYNISMELIAPEKHLRWLLKLPEDYDGWKALYLVSNCVEYHPDKNVVVVQFTDAFEESFREILARVFKNIQ